jgi:hypothetical protein
MTPVKSQLSRQIYALTQEVLNGTEREIKLLRGVVTVKTGFRKLLQEYKITKLDIWLSDVIFGLDVLK